MSKHPAAAAFALLIGLLSPAPSPADEPDTCSTVREFGLEAVAGAEDLVAHCKRTATAGRKRVTDIKSGETGLEDDLDKRSIAYSPSQRRPRAIYFEDDRIDTNEIDTISPTKLSPDKLARLKKAVRATAMLIRRTHVFSTDDGKLKLELRDYKIPLSSLPAPVPLCQTERFHDQKVAGYCTGFLVSEDVIATAGHCVDHIDIDPRDPRNNSFRIVFGFEMQGFGPRDTFETSEVFDAVAIRGRSYERFNDTKPDFALIQLDRPVPAELAEPLRLAGPAGRRVEANTTRLALVGHPSGLPKKVSINEMSRAIELPDAPGRRHLIRAWMNSFEGNSGSPVVFFDEPDVVAGILVSGEPDFAYNPNKKCVRAQVYRSEDTCAGNRRCAEGVTKAEILEPYLP